MQHEIVKALRPVALAAACTLMVGSGATAQRFDHSALDTVLMRHVRGGGVDYASLQADRGGLDRYLDAVGDVDPDAYAGWDEPEKIAFLINAYNGYTLQTIIDRYPIKGGGLLSRIRHPDNSIRQIGGAFDRIEHPVAGRFLTLDGIEHETLRQYFDEPRIHVALVCAAVSCLPLRREAYRAGQLDAQLDDQAEEFFNDSTRNRFFLKDGDVELSKIFDWYGEDFERLAPPAGFAQGEEDADVRGVLAFAAQYLPSETAQLLETAQYNVDFLGYDWTLNDTPEARPTPAPPGTHVDDAWTLSPRPTAWEDFDDVGDWETKPLGDRPTRYEIVTEDQRPSLRAHSERSASILWRPVREEDTPEGAALRHAVWRWKVQSDLWTNDRERERKGDDYAARVFIAFGRDPFSPGSRAICYVWSASEPPGAVYANPYLGDVVTVVLRRGPEYTGAYLAERRDVAADYEHIFGEAPPPISAVGLMTDTDDTGSRATAWFGSVDLTP